MNVVTIAAPKGGSAKTTTAALLAVRAVEDGQNVCLMDLNTDQGNLTQWWVSRGEPFNPYLERNIENITRDVAYVKASKRFEWLFIDTPPLDMDVIENAIALADCVVVPVRASILDVGSIDSVVAMARKHGKRFRFLLSAIDPRFRTLNATALAALAADGPLFETQVSYRLAYINAMTAGKTGPEIARELESEVSELWVEVKALASAKSKSAARSGKGRTS